MKKAVSILVSAICLVAVVFVAIFGTKPQGIVPKVYIESLTIKPSDDSEYRTNSEGAHQCIIHYDANQEIEYDGAFYMPYVFITEIAPENATDRSFAYSSNKKSVIDFPPDSENAHRRGAFLIKKVEGKDFEIAKITARPDDGGSGKADVLILVIVYNSSTGEDF